MEKNHFFELTPDRRLALILGGALSILLIPLIAMQLTNEVQWSVFDFIVAGILLTGTGATLELLLRKFKTFKSRFIAGAVLLIIFFLIWAELAVGIFGTPFAGN
ncbi:hypothetical protein [Flectobacillus longus]|uniref:hypothetical protein n=1 Tax=Flectobacillus longus TaxID=2984207 RepID=UPI0024B6836A|nr:hypothetical protein [Flectobacillus longus]MDI9880218.1 hypothetical protein [Flectobacillus longus]